MLDSAPVLLLAGIAGAGSFTHIRDTAAQHGQTGPMSWAVAGTRPPGPRRQAPARPSPTWA
ncbi:MAG: DUF2637 domain-containing protein [Streptosporangiaceae bacterium]